MTLSIHYYILSLGSRTSRLYEGFRDELIDIQNAEFPYHSITNDDVSNTTPATDQQLRDFFHKTDMHFAHYYEQDPLRLMVVGQSSYLNIFKSLTVHNDVIIGTIKGDYTSTSPHDLGKIVWPVVKMALSGSNNSALLALEEAKELNHFVSGIDAVWNSAESNPGSTLFVEDDYHIKGTRPQKEATNDFVDSVNIWEVFNDVVDVIIEKVLVTGGAVIFLESGSLFKMQRIALILRD